MRIGLFTDSYFPRKDGCAYTVNTWKEKLEERGHDVFIFYPNSRSYSPERNEIPAFSIPNPMHNGHSFALFLSPSSIPELDVVHCHSPGPLGVAGRIYAELKNVTCVYTHHTPLEEYIQPVVKSKLAAKIIEKLYLCYERFLISKFDFLTSNTGGKVRGIDSIELPVGIDTNFFHPSDNDFLEGFEGEKPVIGSNARMSEEKNIEDILKVAENFEGSVILVGEGRHRTELEENAPENVYFRDFLPREELRDFYSSIDLWVTASTSETLSLSSLEASACGTPVVAPDVFPFDKTIKGNNGVLYEPRNIEDFREKIRGALKKSFAPMEVVERFSVEETLDRLEEIYSRDF